MPKLDEVLAGIEVSPPRIPVISNVDAKPHSDPAEIKEILKKQVTAPVQWEVRVPSQRARSCPLTTHGLRIDLVDHHDRPRGGRLGRVLL